MGRTIGAILAVAALLALAGWTSQATAADYISAQNGNWSLNDTWGGGGAPSEASDSVTIQSGHQVTLNVAGIPSGGAAMPSPAALVRNPDDTLMRYQAKYWTGGTFDSALYSADQAAYNLEWNTNNYGNNYEAWQSTPGNFLSSVSLSGADSQLDLAGNVLQVRNLSVTGGAKLINSSTTAGGLYQPDVWSGGGSQLTVSGVGSEVNLGPAGSQIGLINVSNGGVLHVSQFNFQRVGGDWNTLDGAGSKIVLESDWRYSAWSFYPTNGAKIDLNGHTYMNSDRSTFVLSDPDSGFIDSSPGQTGHILIQYLQLENGSHINLKAGDYVSDLRVNSGSSADLYASDHLENSWQGLSVQGNGASSIVYAHEGLDGRNSDGTLGAGTGGISVQGGNYGDSTTGTLDMMNHPLKTNPWSQINIGPGGRIINCSQLTAGSGVYIQYGGHYDFIAGDSVANEVSLSQGGTATIAAGVSIGRLSVQSDWDPVNWPPTNILRSQADVYGTLTDVSVSVNNGGTIDMHGNNITWSRTGPAADVQMSGATSELKNAGALDVRYLTVQYLSTFAMKAGDKADQFEIHNAGKAGAGPDTYARALNISGSWDPGDGSGTQGNVLTVTQTLNATTGLTVDNLNISNDGYSTMHLVFDTGNVAGRDWAFRWLGSHVDVLTAMNAQGLVTWTGGPGGVTIAIDYDVTDDYTYVSYVGSAYVAPHMGDANHDKKVDLQDFSLLKAYYGQTGQPWEHGNFNNDATGLVNLEDFSLLKAHYNHTGDASTSPLTTVPEPATILVLLGAGAAGLWRRRRTA